MATNYPSSIDSLTNPSAGDALTSPSHAGQHANANDAIEAIETELGTTPKGSAASVKARLDGIENGTRLAAGSVMNAALASGIDGAKLSPGIGNLLTANQASGTDTLAATTGFAAYQSTHASSTAQAKSGSRSLAVTATTTSGNYAYFAVDVTAEATYTATVSMRSNQASGETGTGSIEWRATPGGTIISTTAGSAPQSISSAGWTTFAITGTAPSGATSATINWQRAAGANGAITYMDEFSFHRGTGGTWAMPGQPILGLTDAPIGNLLTREQASFESGTTTGWSGATSTTTAQAADGTYSLLSTASGTGGATYWNLSIAANTDLPAVVAGETYTATAKVRSNQASGETALISIYWRADTGGDISGVQSAAVSINNAGWTTINVTGVAPATATRAYIEIRRASGIDGALVYTDCVSLHKGAAGRWAMPGTPITGQSHIATNGAVHLSGTGSPEGVVTAAPGSTWLQTDATTDVKGWIRWVKATGTGNTGWVAGPEADTGLRDVSSLLINGWALAGGGYAHIRRVGNVCELRLSLTGASASADACLSTLGTGLAPNVTETFMASSGASSVTRILHSASWGTECTGRAGVDAVLVYTVSASWPSSLPGSAA